MGLLSGLMGNASEIDVNKLKEEFQQILTDNENIENAYKLIRDLFVFTDSRLILVNKQGVTGKKVEYHSIPYKNIRHFSVESSGHFDLDAELKIWIAGINDPIEKKFNKKCNIYEVQKILAKNVLDI